MSKELKKIYTIDQKIYELQEERKALLDVVKKEKITEQKERDGLYRLDIRVDDVRKVDVSKFYKKVSIADFLRVATVPVGKAEKVLADKELSKVVSTSQRRVMSVVKE